MNHGKETLIEALTQAGHALLELAAPDGSSALILGYGARLLGLFPTGKENLLWTNPLMNSADEAIRFFQARGWRNTGGERTWISPERDLHIADLSDPWNSYTVADAVDPGRFSVAATKSEVALRTSGFVEHRRTLMSCAIELTKRFRLIDNPLHQHPQRCELMEGVNYIGVEQEISLRYSASEGPRFPMSLWDAVNLPAGGCIVVPTGRVIAPTDYFELTGPSHLHCSSNAMIFLFDGLDRHKVSVGIFDLICGRVGYLRWCGSGIYSLVIRNFVIDPSANFIDGPWDAPNDQGYVLQCYNDGGLNGLYGELEYHTAAIGTGASNLGITDRAQLWGFEGPEQNIRMILRDLLGAAVAEEAFLQERTWITHRG